MPVITDPEYIGGAYQLDHTTDDGRKADPDYVISQKRRADQIKSTGNDPHGSATLEEVLKDLEKFGIDYEPQLRKWYETKGEDQTDFHTGGDFEFKNLINLGFAAFVGFLVLRLFKK